MIDFFFVKGTVSDVDSLEYRSSRTEEPFQVLIFNANPFQILFWNSKGGASHY
jgi:hypothetical protein